MRVALAVSLILFLAHETFALRILEGQGRAYPVEEVSQTRTILKETRKTASKKSTAELERHWIVRLKKEPSTALEDSSRTVDISYTVPFNIEDANGKVIVPKGYVYNPLAKIKMTSLIVINGENQDQITWAARKHREIRNSKILISRGSFLRIMRENRLRVYHLDDRIMERLQIHSVPCTLVQKGQRLEITEYRNLKSVGEGK